MGRRVAVELIASATTTDLLRAVQVSPEAAEPILSAAPTLATKPALWRVPMLNRPAAEALVHSLPPEEKIWKAVIAAILQANVGEPAVMIANHLGGRAAAYVLDWIARTERLEHAGIPAAWESVLREDAHAVQEWVGSNPDAPLSAIARVLVFLRPSILDLRLESAPAWRALAERTALESQDSHATVSVQAFALAIAFRNQLAGSDTLAVLCFQPVHDALSAGRLRDHEWQWIRESAPAASERWVSGSDRPSWLRGYFISSFLHYNWNPEQFARGVRNPDTLQRMIPLLLLSPSAWKLLLALGITPESQQQGKDRRR